MTTPYTPDTQYDVIVPAPRPPVEDAPSSETPARPRRNVPVIALAASCAVAVVAAGVLTFALVKASGRADHAESLAGQRADQISELKGNVTSLEGQVSSLTQQRNTAQSDAAAAKAETASVKQQAGRPAYLYTILTQAPAIWLAGESLVMDLGQTVCSTEARGVDRQTIIAAGEGSFPHNQNVAMVTAAEDYLC